MVVDKYFGSIYDLITTKIKQFKFLLLPNFLLFINKKVLFESLPIPAQLILINGPGLLTFGINCNLGYKLGGRNRDGAIELQCRARNSRIIFGNNINTNNNIFICSQNLIKIGDNTLIGQNVSMTDFEAHGTHPNKRNELGVIGEIIIGKNVWIGSNVTILKNTNIGDNSIIATGSVVIGTFPANVIIGGIPAKIISNIL